IYRAAKGILDSCRLLPNAAFGALYPAVTRWATAGIPEARARAAFRRALAAVLGAACAIAIGLTFLAGPLVSLLYGARFAESAALLRLLAWTLVPLVPNTLIAARLFAAGRAWKVAWVSGLGAAATFELNAILVPLLGLAGAAWAVLGAELAMLGLYAPEFLADLGLRLPRPPALLPLTERAAPVLRGLGLRGGVWFVLPSGTFPR